MKPMLLTPANELPIGDEWIYEVKYDGFRCILFWEDEKSPTLLVEMATNLLTSFLKLFSI